jgi:RNA polymerase sigma factor (sigma-70 family)
MSKGFKGYVDVFDETYYVDTYTGEGFDKVLKKIDPFLCKKASQTYIPGYNFDDIKSELTIIALEGIKAYDPYRNTKLSTFLTTHLKNKSISKIRSENRMSKDAFGLSERRGESGEEQERRIKRAREEIHFSQFAPPKNSDATAFEHTIADDRGLHANDKNSFEVVDFETSLVKISSKLDKKTRKIIELVYFKDYSIKDAADAVNLSGWAASMRLKKLANKRSFQSVFGQLEKKYGKQRKK